MATTLTKIYPNRTLSSEQIIEILKSRSLAIADETAAISFFKDVSYFRLAAYLRPMEADKATHQYKPTATFEKAVELYRFDSELRQLVFNAIRHIEISLRTRIIHEFSAADPFWFFDESQCQSKRNYLENMQHIERELQRSKEDFIKDHFKKYGPDCYPPAWKTLETVSFGTLSRLYCNNNDTKAKKRIARSYTVPQHEILESWMKSVNALRNNCAHHARVWNRSYAQIPLLPSRLRGLWLTNTSVDTVRLYAVLSCLSYWFNAIQPDNSFVADFKSLLNKYPNADTAAMGFPQAWEKEPLWESTKQNNNNIHE